LPDGSALVQSGTQDLGTGTYTIMTQIAAETLGIAVARVRFELGDTSLPPAPVSGGSMTTASVGPAVPRACQARRQKIVQQAVADKRSALFGADAKQVTIKHGVMTAASEPAKREELAAFITRRGAPLTARADSSPAPDHDAYASHSFGAVFAEVR